MNAILSINNMNDAVTAKLAVGKLVVQIEVTILWVRKEQSVLRHKLQMIQELGISTYGGGQVNKPRAMLAGEDEYADMPLMMVRETLNQMV